MSVPTVTPSQLISLKGHTDIKEQWLQQQIIDNPSILGLGDLEVYRVEKQQPTGGRVDLILQDDETRYEVEIQLGSLDESHIIRTIEYWDVERRRQPKLRPYRRHRSRGGHEQVPERYLSHRQQHPAYRYTDEGHPNGRAVHSHRDEGGRPHSSTG